MKKTVFFLLIIFACSPQTKEEKAKVAIKKHLSKTMHDFKSYEPVEYGSIDSNYTQYTLTGRYKEVKAALDESVGETNKQSEKASTYLSTNINLADKYLDIAKAQVKVTDSILGVIRVEMASYQPKFDGYVMIHSFRGKNMNGATILTTEKFYFDSTIKSVTRVEEVKDK